MLALWKKRKAGEAPIGASLKGLVAGRGGRPRYLSLCLSERDTETKAERQRERESESDRQPDEQASK